MGRGGHGSCMVSSRPRFWCGHASALHPPLQALGRAAAIFRPATVRSRRMTTVLVARDQSHGDHEQPRSKPRWVLWFLPEPGDRVCDLRVRIPSVQDPDQVAAPSHLEDLRVALGNARGRSRSRPLHGAHRRADHALNALRPSDDVDACPRRRSDGSSLARGPRRSLPAMEGTRRAVQLGGNRPHLRSRIDQLELGLEGGHARQVGSGGQQSLRASLVGLKPNGLAEVVVGHPDVR